MNSIILIFLLLPFFGFSQEPTNSSAKISYKSLNSSLEKLKGMSPEKGAFSYETEIERAEKNVVKIEKYEPGFNLSAQKNEIEKYKIIFKEFTENKAATESKNDAISSDAHFLYKEMEEIFKAPSTSDFDAISGSMSDILSNYEKLCNTFLQTNPSKRVEDAKSISRYNEPSSLYYERNGFEKVIADMEICIKEGTVQDQIERCYYTLKKYSIFWNTLKTALPDDEIAKTNSQLTNESISRIGTLESLKGNAQKNEAALRSKVFMKPAIRSDSTTEELIKIAFKNTGWNEEF